MDRRSQRNRAIGLQADNVRPYLPELVTNWLAEAPETHARELPGSLLFVDVSGFTKLSERLARRGKVGAEELTEAIGVSFSRLLGVAYANGGGLLKFGGDALLLWFTGDDHPGKAARAAVGMRRALREMGPIGQAGPISLRMSAGIHSGTFHFFLVGSSHRELIVTGPAATETVVMESTAAAGEILVSQATARSLPHRCLGRGKEPGILLSRGPRARQLDTGPFEASLAGPAVGIPSAIRAHLQAGRHSEHRRVTVAFLRFEGMDDLIARSGVEAARDALHRLVTTVQEVVDDTSVAFLSSDIDRDGGKIILAAGAPMTTGEDEERMLLSLRRVIESHPFLPLRIGVNRGRVFAGDIGPQYRRTYTVMGDAVNLAARLMAAAGPGRILGTAEVVETSRAAFQAEALEPIRVKGKARLVQAFEIGPVTGSKRSGGEAGVPLVGREREMEQLMAAFHSARLGEGRLVELIGEAGIGKSRLLKELHDRAEGSLLFSTRCELYESSTPYFPFHALLRQALRLGGADDPVSSLRALVEREAPGVVPRLPLVGMTLGLELPPTPETAQLDERFRRARLEEAVLDLLSATLTDPTVMTFEDAHWMDEASADLLARLVEAAPNHPWLICVTRRDVTAGYSSTPGPNVVSMRPEPLNPVQAAVLVQAASEETPLPPHQIAALAQRSGGNPLFLQELLAAARQGQDVGELPDSIEAAITARIDRLPSHERMVLRRAAVLGSAFSDEVLRAVFTEANPPDDATWAGLAEFVIRSPDGTFQFQHDLIRDAAYEGLPYRLRRELHARVADTIEREAFPDLQEVAELLAVHYLEAGRYDAALLNARVAAKRAKAIYANVDAAALYERALKAARHVPDVSPKIRSELHEALGDVHERLGEYGKAAEAYRAARRLVSNDVVAEARLLLKQGFIPDRAGRYSVALRWIRRGLRLLEGVPGRAAQRQRAQLTVWYGAIRQAQGRQAEAIQLCRRAIKEAGTSGERDALAHAYYLLDWALVDVGRREDATNSEAALSIYRQLDDLGGQATVLNNMGAFAYWSGRWDEAVERYRNAREAWLKIGDEVNAAVPTSGIGEILLERGLLQQAERHLRDALRIWRAAGYLWGIAYALLNLGRIAARSGDFARSLSLVDQAGARFREVGAEDYLTETEIRRAETLVLQGRGEAALSVVDQVLARPQSKLPVTLGPALHRIRGYALMQQSDLRGAREALNESLALSRDRQAEHEVAFTLHAMVDMARLSGQAPPPGLEKQREDAFTHLGIVTPPDVPVSAVAFPA